MTIHGYVVLFLNRKLNNLQDVMQWRAAMTTSNEAGDASASAQPGAASGAASSGGGSAKKRLLPMELRRRRRAAKLQITSERDVATINARDIIESLEEKNSPDDTSAIDAGNDETTRATETPPPPAKLQDTFTKDVFQVHEETEKNAPRENAADPLPAPSTSSAAKKIQNLFSFSLQDRKRQRLLQRESLVDVPTYMKLDRVPLDLAPKSKAVITMSFPFPFTRPRPASMAAAVSGQNSDNIEVRWLRALQYYAHPASPLPPSLNAATDRQLEENEFYVNRFRMWQDSFRHAYFSFRRLDNDGTLYVRYPEFVACLYVDVGRQSELKTRRSILDMCNAYISRQGEAKTDDQLPRQRNAVCAVISQSNARLRKELSRRGVAFHMPFNLSGLQKVVTSLDFNDEDAVNHSVKSINIEQSVHGPDSLLQFSGHQAVHGLFEFLLNRKPLSNQDVPQILSSFPFANATIQSISVRYMGNGIGRATGVQDEETSAPTHRSEVELSGFCLPTAIEILVDCLENSHREGADGTAAVIKVAMETAPMSERLNAALLKVYGTGSTTAIRTAREREEWKQQLDFAKRRLQSIKKKSSTTGSVVEVEMAAR